MLIGPALPAFVFKSFNESIIGLLWCLLSDFVQTVQRAQLLVVVTVFTKKVLVCW